jgi:hypothetical protein
MHAIATAAAAAALSTTEQHGQLQQRWVVILTMLVPLAHV